MSLLTSAIKHSPRLHGFTVDVWTREQVGILIEREFGFSYSTSHINRIIRDLGLTRSSPNRRAAGIQNTFIARMWWFELPSAPALASFIYRFNGQISKQTASLRNAKVG